MIVAERSLLLDSGRRSSGLLQKLVRGGKPEKNDIYRKGPKGNALLFRDPAVLRQALDFMKTGAPQHNAVHTTHPMQHNSAL